MDHKPFSQAEYLECDGPAKVAVRTYLEGKGWHTNAMESMGADISSVIPVLHECQVNKRWTEKDWPFDDIRIPARKARLLEGGQRIIFWVLSADCTQAMRIDGRCLTDDLLQTVKNSAMPQGEMNFVVPLKMAAPVQLGGGS